MHRCTVVNSCTTQLHNKYKYPRYHCTMLKFVSNILLNTRLPFDFSAGKNSCCQTPRQCAAGTHFAPFFPHCSVLSCLVFFCWCSSTIRLALWQWLSAWISNRYDICDIYICCSRSKYPMQKALLVHWAKLIRLFIIQNRFKWKFWIDKIPSKYH